MTGYVTNWHDPTKCAKSLGYQNLTNSLKHMYLLYTPPVTTVQSNYCKIHMEALHCSKTPHKLSYFSYFPIISHPHTQSELHPPVSPLR